MRCNVTAVAERRISVCASECLFFFLLSLSLSLFHLLIRLLALSFSFSLPLFLSSPLPLFPRFSPIARTHLYHTGTKGFNKPRVSPVHRKSLVERVDNESEASVRSAAATRPLKKKRRTRTCNAMYVVKIVYCQVTMEFVDRDLGTSR